MKMGSGSYGAAVLTRQICSITDPFCPAAKGAKFPDSGATNTLAWQSESYLTLTTDASGRAAAFCSPDPGSYVSVATAYTGSTGNAVNLASTPLPAPNFSNFTATGFCNFRVVSHGVQIRGIMSQMNSQGTLGIVALPAALGQIVVGTTPTSIDLDSTNFADNKRISCNTALELTAVSRPDAIFSKEFKTPTTPAAATVVTQGNEVLIPYIVGGPASSACIQIRMITNYELEFTVGTVFNQLATPQASDNPTVVKGQGAVFKAVDRIVVGGSKEIERRTMGAAEAFGRWAASAGMRAIGGLLGGPPGAAMAGAIMDAPMVD